MTITGEQRNYPGSPTGSDALQQHHLGVAVAKSSLEVSSPVAKASAAPLISDCVCAPGDCGARRGPPRY
jgi:hypothetical protein